jgi:hypothetical protein
MKFKLQIPMQNRFFYHATSYIFGTLNVSQNFHKVDLGKLSMNLYILVVFNLMRSL